MLKKKKTYPTLKLREMCTIADNKFKLRNLTLAARWHTAQ